MARRLLSNKQRTRNNLIVGQIMNRKRVYTTPTLCQVPLQFENMVCASPEMTIPTRDAVAGEEADSRAFGGVLFFDDENN